ncbi:unnamed protein product [Sphagnum jensenii]|uniref:BAG domain-containing protein n=1 Tax=Sphagnum jensenii TaxID=128206 RepID=A0ABP0WIQ8_9BRYO
MGGGLLDNLSPYDMYEPTRTGVRNGAYSWPRSPVMMDPHVFREQPGYNAAAAPASRYVRPQWNDRPTSVGASPVRRSTGEARDSPAVDRSERRSSPAVRKVRTIPVQDGSYETPQKRISVNKAAPVLVVKESGKDRFPSVKKSSRAAVDVTSAATVIQSVYRGYAVRRTEPLKHLRIISKVRLELKELVNRVAEPEQFDKLRRDALERLKWNEVSMAMLLRLDSIQGAHPVVRDIRKSVAKEVVQFQEIVDAALNSHDNKETGVEGRENGDDLKTRSDTIHDEQIVAELNDTEEGSGGSSVRRDGESAGAHVQESEGKSVLEHMDVEGSTVVEEDEPDETDSHMEVETPVSLPISSQSACIADTEMAHTGEWSIPVVNFVPQPPQAASSGLPETADLNLLHVNRTGQWKCRQDTVDASGTWVKSTHHDDTRAAAEEAGHAGVSSGQEDLVMECLVGGGSPFFQAIAKDSGRDSGEYKKMKDDTQCKDIEELQPEAHNIGNDDATELKVIAQEEVSVNMQEEVVMGNSQLEEAGRLGRSTEVLVSTKSESDPGSNPLVIEEPSDHKNKLSRNMKSSGMVEEEMDVGKVEPAACLVNVDLEQDVPMGAMMCDECGSPGRSTEVMLANGDKPDSNHEIVLLGRTGVAGAAEGEADHGNSEYVSYLPCLQLKTLQGSGHGDRIQASSGDLGIVATEVGEMHPSTAIIFPELTSLGEVTGLSDRALMQKLMEENRKLKAAIGEVLQWGKQQSDIIHNLAKRIEQLEAKVSDSDLLKNGTNVIKKRSKTVGMLPRDTLSAGEEVESVCRPPRSGRFGRHHGRNRLHHLEDGHWSSSAESEEFF